MQDWQITYYKKKSVLPPPRAGENVLEQDFTGLDDEVTPYRAIMFEQPESVADLCTGRGLTLLAAHKFGGSMEQNLIKEDWQ